MHSWPRYVLFKTDGRSTFDKVDFGSEIGGLTSLYES